jgi:hypothetical protein
MNKIGQNACKFSSNIPDILLKFACILANFIHFAARKVIDGRPQAMSSYNL